MGGGHSKQYLSESELSPAESDSEWFDNTTERASQSVQTSYFLGGNMVSESDERTDAALRDVSLPEAERVITLAKVVDIEKQLDCYEIVSLVYLLYDTSELALKDLQLLIVYGMQSDLLHLWAKSEDNNGNRKWQSKLVEALCIIQNYKILKDLGFTKDDLIAKYIPHRAVTSWFVNRTRKAFYLIAEKLGIKETVQFIHNMKKRLQKRNITSNDFTSDYLELYFLFWEQIHLDIGDIRHTFKEMGLEECYDIVNSVIPPETSNTAMQDFGTEPLPKMVKGYTKPKDRRKSTTKDTTSPQRRSVESNYSRLPQPGTSDISHEGFREGISEYLINRKFPGIVLIINQEEFYTETDPKYKHLLHENNDRVKLETREGTRKDKEKLKHIFERRGYQIKETRDNLPHYEIIDTIKEVVKMISIHSSLIVCILSHGDNGVVYGANSCKVEVNQIQNIMCKRNKHLNGKPKVLILQSCQGKQCQKKESTDDEDEENSNTKDGPSTITADLLTFWATVPGFAAIRNKNKGSWLIQELCDEIEQLSSRHHFLDICIKVAGDVGSKEWKEKTGINIMTPMVVTTFTKLFYLPPPRSNQ